MPYVIDDFPRQKISVASKTKRWAKECAQSAAQLLLNNDTSLRKSRKNKLANYNLRINEIDTTDVQSTCDPHKLYGDTLPDSFKHIGRGNAYINLLIGEKLKRSTEYKAYLSSKDQDGISMKETAAKEELLQKVSAEVMDTYKDEKQAEQRLGELKNYLQYDWQDIREKTANQMLKREVQRQEVLSKFAGCFEDALVSGEEIIHIDVVGRDIVVRKVNPLQFYTIGTGFSEKVEDADIIVEYEYLSTGQIIDRYYEELKPTQIDSLERGDNGKGKEGTGNPFQNLTVADGNNGSGSIFGGVYVMEPNQAAHYGRYRDSKGNTLVTHVNWRSRKKIGELTYFNPDDGAEEKTIVPEGYIPDDMMGETIKWYWVNEWYKATLIGEDDLVDWGPIPFQGRSLHQLSVGSPNYVGLYFNTNQGEVHSLMDVIKPLDYSYDIAHWNRDKLIAKHFGSTVFYNLSMVPSGWDPERWMDYAINKGFAPLDPTNEILKGPSQGKSAGVYNQMTATSITSGAAQDIQMYTDIMLGLEDQMSKISGISPQREAQISASESATGSQLAYQQSAAITEIYFHKHALFEKRALSLLLEKCKYLYSKHPQAGQYMFDELGVAMISSYDEIGERTFDIHISNSGKEAQLQGALKELSHAAMQNGQATFSDIMSIYLSDSTQDLAKKLKISAETIQQQQQQAEADRLDKEMADREAARTYDKWIKEREFDIEERKIELAEMEFEDKIQDTNRNWIKDEVEYDMALLDQQGKDKDRASKEKMEAKKLATQVKIAGMKPKPTSK